MSPSVEPFNEAKYKALMDGLECSERLLSSLEEGIRIDAELYQKKYVVLEDFAETHETTTFIREANLVKKGIFDISASCYSSFGIPFVRISNIKNMLLSKSDLVFIPESENEKNQDTQLSRGDIILSKTGSPAASYVNFDICNVSQDTVAIKLKNPSQLFSEYVVVYLNTVYGLVQMEKRFTGNIQKHLNLDDCKKKLIIPVFSIQFQRRIKELFLSAAEGVEQADCLYNETIKDIAQLLCYCEVSNSESISIISLNKSFKETGRLDAEYYQPKYDALFKVLAKISTKKLGGENGIVDMMKSIEPGSEAYVDEGIPFIRVSDMSKYEITESEIKLDPKVIPSPEKLFPKKDTILFSKDGSVGIAYKVEDDMSVITSGALLHLTVRDTSEVLPDYLTLVLNSPVVQLQAERDSNGAIIQHWKPSEIENVVIPVLDMEIQKEISAKVQESFALRRQSKQLLEYAKQAVEMAIEQGEDVALEWLKNKADKEV